MKHRPLLYLPIETKARELVGKTYLAARAVERDWIVVAGHIGEVRRFVKENVPGVFVEIGIPERKAERLERLHQLGHRIVNLCEEAFVYGDGRDYCDRKIGIGTLPWVDRLFLPGKNNAKDVESFRPAFFEKSVISGNPRFDTLLPGVRSVFESEAAEIRKKLGRFILVNTNFGRVNPQESNLDVENKLVEGGSNPEFVRRHIDFKRRQMQGLRRLLEGLAKTQSHSKIVLRPHPGENHNTWRKWADPLNIDVRYEGSANEWMLAADAVLHTGCTTAIEGLLLERPVFSYVPEPDSEFLLQADRISRWVSSAGELLAGIDALGSDHAEAYQAAFEPQRDELRSVIVNVEPPYAADRILNVLEQLDVPRATPEQLGLQGRLWTRLGVRLRASKTLSEQAKQKFSDVLDQEIQAPLQQWVDAKVLSCVPKVTRMTDRLWALH
jgi:surface carbohydrate biosynthesis protein